MRDRQFSDISIAESCIDTHVHSNTLIKRRPAINLMNQPDISSLSNDIIHSFGDVNSTNILDVTDLIFHSKVLRKQNFDTQQQKTVIIELLSEAVDNTFKYTHEKYTDVYRPILKDIVPRYIDTLIHFENTVVKKKSCCIL